MDVWSGAIGAGLMCGSLTWLLQKRPPYSGATVILVPIGLVFGLLLVLNSTAA